MNILAVNLLAAIAVAATFEISSTDQAAGPKRLPPRHLAGVGHFSEDVFNMLFSHPVDDPERVSESIKKAITTGNSQLVGGLSLDFVPDSQRGRIDFVLRGQLKMDDATAVQRQVRVNSQVHSQIDARKSVFFERDQLREMGASASCPTSIQVRDVQANRRMIERIATRRVHRELREVESIVAERTSQRIRERLDDRIGAAMKAFESRLHEFFRFEDAGFGLFPPEVNFSSTDRHLQLSIEAQSGMEVANSASKARLDPELDIHLVLHQQVFANLATYRLAGRHVHDNDILTSVERLRGNAPWSLWVHQRRPRWSIQFAESQPLEVKLRDGNMVATISLAEFQYGPATLAGPIQVEVVLRPEITSDGPCIHRLAVPEIRVDRASQKSLSEESERRLTDILREKCEGIFPEHAYFDRMQPPAGGSWNKVKSLMLERLRVDDEWFEIGYQFQSDPTSADFASK